ncbi:hypothetical protein DFJ73DRAFT_781800 [Zopfochytrium polystomum]|nr:hypothetical protein DFJ73DRAFT_781800 [Zopfochytrium polystomum]
MESSTAIPFSHGTDASSCRRSTQNSALLPSKVQPFHRPLLHVALFTLLLLLQVLFPHTALALPTSFSSSAIVAVADAAPVAGPPTADASARRRLHPRRPPMANPTVKNPNNAKAKARWDTMKKHVMEGDGESGGGHISNLDRYNGKTPTHDVPSKGLKAYTVNGNIKTVFDAAVWSDQEMISNACQTVIAAAQAVPALRYRKVVQTGKYKRGVCIEVDLRNEAEKHMKGGTCYPKLGKCVEGKVSG